MKLLVISPIFPNKDETYTQGVFIREHVHILADFFDEIFVIVPVPSTFGLLDQDKLCKDYVFKIKNTRIRVYYPRYVYFPAHHLRSSLDVIWYKAIAKLIKNKKLDFDYIYANFTWQAGAVASIFYRQLNKKYFLHVHENAQWFFKEYRSKNKKYEESWKNAIFLIRPTVHDIHYLKRFNNSVFKIPYPVDTDTFKPLEKEYCKRKLGIDINKKMILNVANYVPQKNQSLIIEAANLLLNKYGMKDLIFYIIGGGKLKRYFKELIEKYKLEEYVKLRSYIPHRDLVCWYNASDIFLLPSISESFGVVAIEALSCGIPVITTKNGGTEYIIKKKKYLGKVLNEKDNANELAVSIIELLEKNTHYTKLIRNYVLANYSFGAVRRIWSKILNTYIE